ncbi:MAG: amidase [Gammaproteobacteria bacterium]|nr:amidase [Gammaproteobacteria bacterium]
MPARTFTFLVSLTMVIACGESDPSALSRADEVGPEAASTMTAMLTADPQADASQRRVALALQRIDEQDRHYRAVLHLNPRAERIAADLDAVPAAQRGALHGIPVLVKDNVETADMPTTAGAHALAGLHTGRDAGVVQRLREAGAIILGKTNLSEWANFRSERASSGWSGLGGQTRNAVDASRSPCGSSSGSAVAVALGYVPLAIGTETNGSVICPAAINGVVGFKPTVGALPGDGIIPIAHTQDTAGPMTLTVADAALAHAVMAGIDPETVLTAVRAGDATGLRIGILRGASGYHEGVDALFDIAIAELRRTGAALVDDLAFRRYEGFGGDSYAVLLHEFRHDLNAWFATLPEAGRVTSLEELIAFNRAHAEQAMPYFGQEIFIKADATAGLDSDTYREALARIRAATREEGIDAMLAEHDLDFLIAPSTGPAWSIDLVNGDHYLGGFSTYPAVAGYPHLTVPMGTVHGLPIGLSITSRRDADVAVLALGHAFEQLDSRPNIGAALPQQ